MRRIVFLIHTPAHVHLFRNAIVELKNRGHQINLIVRDSGATVALLDYYGFKYEIYLKANRRKLLKLLQTPQAIFKEYLLTRKFKPDVLVGIGADESLAASLNRKSSIIVNDSEPMPLQHMVNRVFASAILTPSCFRKDLGKKQIRYNGYKELAYLHPNYFKPDPTIYNELKINTNEPYVILRFNAFSAFHDIGKHGFSVSDQITLVKELEKYARVFISPEGNLPRELAHYRLPIEYNRIHHALYYAYLLVTDTQTMTTEAAILGCPVVRSNNWVGPNDMGNFVELEQKYDIIYSFQKSVQAIQKAIELIKQPDLKEQWTKKRQRLLNEKIDVTGFLVDFIENYPESYNKLKASQMSNSFDSKHIAK